jgi:hypothetical protein
MISIFHRKTEQGYNRRKHIADWKTTAIRKIPTSMATISTSPASATGNHWPHLSGPGKQEGITVSAVNMPNETSKNYV